MLIYGNSHKGYDRFVSIFLRGLGEKGVDLDSAVISIEDQKLFNHQIAQSSSRKYGSLGHIPMPAGHKLKRKLMRRNKGFGQKCYM